MMVACRQNHHRSTALPAPSLRKLRQSSVCGRLTVTGLRLGRGMRAQVYLLLPSTVAALNSPLPC